ncbi:MAG: hypothetical protein EPN84_00225 [Legionella sp.]|nr:MAG: hypothetical protein EPN84_00225 [Legionella sp.]
MPSDLVLRSFFFSNPKRSAFAVWTVSTLGLFIGLCLEVIPRGLANKNAGKNLDDAGTAFKTTYNEMTDLNRQIAESKQRVMDLDCAKAGYMRFNGQLIDLLRLIVSSQNLTSTDVLKLYGGLQFIPDQAVNQSTTVGKSYTTYTFIYVNKILISTPHYHPYKETTTINFAFQNMLQGSGLSIAELDCGFYSRRFKIKNPDSFLVRETSSTTGEMSSGLVLIQINRNYGSHFPLSYTLDGQTVVQVVDTAGYSNQETATVDLSAKLFQFLAAAVAAFNATGINYPQLQQDIQNRIPSLTDMSHSINATFLQRSHELSHQQMISDDLNNAFRQSLALWLSLTLGIPMVLAFITYYIAVKCNTPPSENANEDIEMQSAVSDDGSSNASDAEDTSVTP